MKSRLEYYKLAPEGMNAMLALESYLAKCGLDRKLLHKALDKLTERERTIMELRFGLADGEEKTQKDVADLLGW